MLLKTCETKFCRNKAAKSRRICYACKSRRWRENNPMRAAYISQKAHAKERKIPFNLTFEQFEAFAIKYKLIGNRGRSKFAFHIDRINEDDPRGYHIDNIQRLTNSENAKKEQARRKQKLDFDWRQPEFTSWIKDDVEPDPEAPF